MAGQHCSLTASHASVVVWPRLDSTDGAGSSRDHAKPQDVTMLPLAYGHPAAAEQLAEEARARAVAAEQLTAHERDCEASLQQQKRDLDQATRRENEHRLETGLTRRRCGARRSPPQSARRHRVASGLSALRNESLFALRISEVDGDGKEEKMIDPSCGLNVGGHSNGAQWATSLRRRRPSWRGGRDGGAHDVADGGPCSHDRLYGASRQAGGRCSADATVGAHAGWLGHVPRLS